jgi:hypothetical protein
MTAMTRRAVASASRSYVQAGSSDGARRAVIALGRANSRSPSSPPMRPNPESPTPPYGRLGMAANDSTEFTAVMPDRMRRASSSPRRQANTDRPARPAARWPGQALLGVADPGHHQHRTESLLPHRGRVLGDVDQDGGLHIRRLHRLGPAQCRRAAVGQPVGDVPADGVELPGHDDRADGGVVVDADL